MKKYRPWKVLLRILSMLGQHKRKYLLGCLLGALEIITTLLLPFIYQQITLVVTNEAKGNAFVALWIGIGIILLLTPFVCMGTYLQRSTAAIAESEMRKRTFAHMQRQPLEILHGERIGGLITLLSNDIPKATTCLTNFANASLFKFVVLFFASVFSLFYYEWRIACGAIAIGFLSFLSSILLSPRVRSLGCEAQKYAAESSAFLLDGLRGLPIIRVFLLYDKRAEDYSRVCNTVKRYRIKFRLLASFVDGLIVVLQYATEPLALIFGLWLVRTEGMSIDQVVLVAGMASVMAEAFYSLSQFISFIQNSIVSGQRIFEFLDTPIEQNREKQSETNELYPYALELQNVTFGYEAEQTVLNNISLSVPTGAKIAIIGESGGGKSTLLKLIEGLYAPSSGRILYFGNIQTELTLTQIRSLCAYVPQECTLFEGTIADNIAMGKIGCSFSDIKSAAKKANLHEYISSLPDGYDTHVGERGLQLSGGQRQRIAIARAFIRNSPLLLLDEATASLDAESEKEVLEAMDALMVGRTVIMLTHRLSSLKYCDRFYALKNGKLHLDNK